MKFEKWVQKIAERFRQKTPKACQPWSALSSFWACNICIIPQSAYRCLRRCLGNGSPSFFFAVFSTNSANLLMNLLRKYFKRGEPFCRAMYIFPVLLGFPVCLKVLSKISWTVIIRVVLITCSSQKQCFWGGIRNASPVGDPSQPGITECEYNEVMMLHSQSTLVICCYYWGQVKTIQKSFFGTGEYFCKHKHNSQKGLLLVFGTAKKSLQNHASLLAHY